MKHGCAVKDKAPNGNYWNRNKTKQTKPKNFMYCDK